MISPRFWNLLRETIGILDFLSNDSLIRKMSSINLKQNLNKQKAKCYMSGLTAVKSTVSKGTRSKM